MKTICIDARYIFPQMDGIGRYLFNLIKHLSLVTDAEDIQYLILEIEDFSRNSILRTLDDRKNLTFIRTKIRPQSIANHFIHKEIANFSIDLYHYPQFDFPAFLPFKSVITIHDMNPQRFPGFFRGIKGLVKRFYSIATNYIGVLKADGIITVSENTAVELIELYGYKLKRKTTPILLAVEKRFWGVVDDEIELKFTIKLGEMLQGSPYFLYVGNNRPHKNLEILIESYSVLKKTQTNAPKLILVGKFAKYSHHSIDEHISRLELEDSVFCTMATEDELLLYYRNALALVFISLSEGFGFPVLEAMASGTPVIASNTGAVFEICGDAALTVDPKNKGQIVDALMHIWQSDELRCELIKKGAQRVTTFSWEQCAKETLNLYKKILYGL